MLRVQPNGTKIWKLIQNGKPRTLGTMPVMTYSMAVEKALAILRGEDPDAKPEEPPVVEVMTFGKYLTDHYNEYLEQNYSRPKETQAYLASFKLADKPLEDIRLADVETWRIKKQKAGLKPATINRQSKALKTALQRAVDLDLLPTNPLARLKFLKFDKRPVIRYLTDAENKRLLATLMARDSRLREGRRNANEWRKERDYDLLPELGEYADNLTPLVMLALNTGLRRGELWNLQWGDIDLKRQTLTVHGKGAKSGQTRHIPLNNTAVSVLKIHKGKVAQLPANPVFGKHFFQKSFGNLLKAARIENFRFHDIRHTFASRLVMAGVPLNTVRELMGHSSIEMTLIYAHLAPDNLRAAVEMLP
ncbi:MAG: tyrosine-type recombinase/integrase [Gammaproteobacteria bacterium]|nr:tyrosine-type recombinase/integrase [Gammaproteobacteria bacterium]